MTSNETGKDTTTEGKPLDDSTTRAANPSNDKRELTDDEIAAVAAGASGGWNIKSNKTV